ncbi:MAG: hypothetical protein ABS38_04385 [Acidovorax sp. SCN 68-22]|jgi:hypothetical protein|nr:hypothetical protein [Simplicispira sp.]ODS69620.1 MAG: hypothetical protein ABS38_04385 [Acidovorax sp. SCN 68-22]
MDPALLLLLGGAALYAVNRHQQRQRIALLAHFLGPLQIEKLMETLTQGYLRALGESDPTRQAQVFAVLEGSEAQLAAQFAQLAREFAAVPAAQARASTLALSFPWASVLLPAATFDLRKLLAVHANGIAQALRSDAGLSPRDRAYRISAELFLMQHSCHWFCKSRAVASARMLARHQTPHAQLVASVGPQTRSAYLALTGG